MVAKTDTKSKEFKILYPETDVELCGSTFTIRQWSAIKAKNNAKRLQGPFVKLASGALTDELINEVFDEAFDEITLIISEDYELDLETVHELPAPECVKAFRGILEANMSFFDELQGVQTILPMK